VANSYERGTETLSSVKASNFWLTEELFASLSLLSCLWLIAWFVGLNWFLCNRWNAISD
jgi:hypothetical protein